MANQTKIEKAGKVARETFRRMNIPMAKITKDARLIRVSRLQAIPIFSTRSFLSCLILIVSSVKDPVPRLFSYTRVFSKITDNEATFRRLIQPEEG